MKKIFLVAILMFTLVMSVTACKQEPANPVDTGSVTTDGENTTEEVPDETTAEPSDETQEPAETTVTTEAPTDAVVDASPASPDEPPFLAGPAELADAAASGAHIGSADVMSENGVDFVRITANGEDPQLTVSGNLGVMPDYLVFAYRTSGDTDGEMFVGTTANGPNGQNDRIALNWNEDNRWNLMIVDLANSTSSGILYGNIGYIRLDPFVKNTDAYIDLAFIGFFNTVANAEAYYSEVCFVKDAAYLAAQAGDPNASCMDVGEATTAFDRSFVRLSSTGADPWFMVLKSGANVKANYLAVSYRTNSDSQGEFFVGSGDGPIGGSDEVTFDWNENGNWNLLLLDLSAVEGLTSIENDIINYLRLDIFTDGGAEGEYVDIEYIGFFTSPAEAESYYRILHEPKSWNSELGKTLVKSHGFDALPVIGADGSENHVIFENGASADWNQIVNADFSLNTLKYLGWIGVYGELGEFGYQIDNGEYVFSADFAVTPEQADVDAVGAEAAASRMGILIDVSKLNGAHTIRTLYKSAEGYVVKLTEFTIIRKQNIALNKPITSTSVQANTEHYPENANDGNLDTRFGAEARGTFDLILDLEAIYTISEMHFIFEQAMMEYTISVSEDGVTYTEVAAGERYGFTSDPIEVTFDMKNVSGRYIKITRLPDDGSTDFWLSIWEMNVYGIAAE